MHFKTCSCDFVSFISLLKVKSDLRNFVDPCNDVLNERSLKFIKNVNAMLNYITRSTRF